MIVIGAGITGLMTVYQLASRGYKNIIVFDKERYVAQRCSFANGGQLSVSNSEVWTSFSNIKRAIKWSFKKEAPFYIGSLFSFSKLKWLFKFV